MSDDFVAHSRAEVFSAELSSSCKERADSLRRKLEQYRKTLSDAFLLDIKQDMVDMKKHMSDVKGDTADIKLYMTDIKGDTTVIKKDTTAILAILRNP